MDVFPLYFGIGKDHILDFGQGLDHILFVLALTVVTRPQEWKKVLILITSFTIGHSLTLALATLNIINVPASLTEFLICLTILITAVSNLINKKVEPGAPVLNFWYAGIFGLIHGLGFSNMLRAMLSGSSDLIWPLFAFNVGLEFGQIIVVALFSLLTYAALEWFKVRQRDWIMIFSAAIAGMALMLIIERIDQL